MGNGASSAVAHPFRNNAARQTATPSGAMPSLADIAGIKQLSTTAAKTQGWGCSSSPKARAAGRQRRGLYEPSHPWDHDESVVCTIAIDLPPPICGLMQPLTARVLMHASDAPTPAGKGGGRR
jgi:hypothetical protein